MLLMKTTNILRTRAYINDIEQRDKFTTRGIFKAENVVSLNVKNKSSVTDTMIIASGRSTRHVKSISDNIIKKLKKDKIKPLGIERGIFSKSEWVLIDFGDVLVHVMHPEAREFYSLEKLWDESLSNENII